MSNPKVTTLITDARLKELAESPFRVVADSAETKLIAQELLELREAARNTLYLLGAAVKTTNSLSERSYNAFNS